MEHYFIFVANIIIIIYLFIYLFFGITDYFSTEFVHAIFVCRNLSFITFNYMKYFLVRGSKWYGVHTKFRENLSSDSRVGKGNARTDSMVMLQI